MSVDHGRYTEGILLAGYLRKGLSLERFEGLMDDVSGLLEGALQYNKREDSTATELSDRVSSFNLAIAVTDRVRKKGVYTTWKMLENYQDSLRKVKESEDISEEEKGNLCVFLSELGKYCGERFNEDIRKGPVSKAA